MGSGASSFSAEDKMLIVKQVEGKYKELNNSSEVPQTQILQELFEAYHNAEKTIQQTKGTNVDFSDISPTKSSSAASASESTPMKQTLDDKEVKTPNHTTTEQVKDAEKTPSSDTKDSASNGHVLNKPETDEIPPPPPSCSPAVVRKSPNTRLAVNYAGANSPKSPMIKRAVSNEFRIARTISTELVDKANALVEDQKRVASFIEQLKDGDIRTRRASGFRIRRLTYAQKTDEEPEEIPAITVPRTTIYASTEIGVRQEKLPPFPPMILGTFSCHGIEPAPDNFDEDVDEHVDEDEEEKDDNFGIVEKINQDRGCVVHPFNHSYNEVLLLVLDGHGEQGDRVSEFAMRNIVNMVEKNLESGQAPPEALIAGFVEANTALMATPIKFMTSGTTCVSLYVKGNTFWVANCGDSRAVMAVQSEDGEILAHNLSRDHKPDDPEEAQRIREWGGFVSPPPEPGLSSRVWLDPAYTMIGLAMARSIGDYAVKAVGVIPSPEVAEYEFTPNDKFLILATDGVWEFISSQEAVEIVQTNLHMGAHFACQELIQTAAVRWQEEEGDYRDDITAIILTLPLPLNNGTK